MAVARQFTKGDDPMRTFRQLYVAGRFLKKGVALATIVESDGSSHDVALRSP
jgi:hypothetical protein